MGLSERGTVRHIYFSAQKGWESILHHFLPIKKCPTTELDWHKTFGRKNRVGMGGSDRKQSGRLWPGGHCVVMGKR